MTFPEVPRRILVRQEDIARLQAERDEAVALLERVHFLRANGERPPGAPEDDPEAETWGPLDLEIEAFLQRTIPGT